MRTVLDAARREILADLTGTIEAASLDDDSRARLAVAMTELLDRLLMELDTFACDADRRTAAAVSQFTLTATWPLLLAHHAPALLGERDGLRLRAAMDARARMLPA
ncbi:MAG: hypothetical protein GEV05_27415 [Betaproteobacteria bacterium]|nr:hypothetical protein [Betaproteobacteria bacterium]